MITDVKGREILDSRGNPTVEVEVWAGKVVGRGIAPSGASTGKHEALELRDGGKRYLGKGVLKAVRNVNEIIKKELVGREVEPKELDEILIEKDGTENKSKLGANSLVATSIALYKLKAKLEEKNVYELMGGNLLPIPLLNIINGGKHAGNNLAIQEFMIVPHGFESFSEALKSASETYHILGKNLEKKYGKEARNVGDEGGYAPPLNNSAEAIEQIERAVEEAGYKGKIGYALDAAASSFYSDGKYAIDGKILEKEEMQEYYKELVESYGIMSIEDPFYEEDFESFAELKRRINIQVVGDDLLVTNPKRLKMALEKNSVNALLLKINQIGTVSESIKVAEMCKKNGIKVVVSHRSGESEDPFIAELAVGLNAGQIKTGAPARGERTCKYNQLLRIEEKVKEYARWKLD